MRIPKVLRVLYSPSKAFKELAEKPSYIGVILILVLFVASNLLANYVANAKYYIQNVKPDLFKENSDVWTENATLWISNGDCITDDDSVYGDHSIAFTITDKNELSMQMNLSEEIDCSANNFNQTSFSLKFTESSDKPLNISLILFSGNNGYFMRY